MTVHVLREALVLGHLGHLDEVALATFEKALEIRLLKPLVVIGKPLEQVVGVEVHRTIGDVVVWHGGSFPRLLRLPNNILLKKRDGAERPSLFG